MLYNWIEISDNARRKRKIRRTLAKWIRAGPGTLGAGWEVLRD